MQCGPTKGRGKEPGRDPPPSGEHTNTGKGKGKDREASRGNTGTNTGKTQGNHMGWDQEWQEYEPPPRAK